MDPVQLTTFSRRRLTRTVYKTKRVSPYTGWFVPLGSGYKFIEYVNHYSKKQKGTLQ